MEREGQATTTHDEILAMTAQIVSAYVSHNELSGVQIPEVIRTVFSTLNSQRTAENATPQEPPKPAVPIRKSVMPDYIVCLEDGKKSIQK